MNKILPRAISMLFTAVIACAAMTAKAKAPESTLRMVDTNEIPSAYWGEKSNSHIYSAVKVVTAPFLGSPMAGIIFDLKPAPKMIDCQIFIKSSLDREENLYEQPFEPVAGQNIVWLDFPFNFDSYPEIYVGVEMTCRGNVVGYNQDADKLGRSFVRTGSNAWKSLSEAVGSQEAFTIAPFVETPEVSTSLVFAGNHLPAIVTANKDICLRFDVINKGTATVRDIKFETRINGDSQSQMQFATEMINGQVCGFDIPVNVSLGANQLELLAMDSVGEVLASTYFALDGYEVTYPRIPLVEQFTSQYCANCPDGEEAFEAAAEAAGAQVITIAHHSGFRPDSFTLPQSDALAQLLGVASNPLMMLDRRSNLVPSASGELFHPSFSTPEMFADYLVRNDLTGVEIDKAVFYADEHLLTVELTAGKDPTLPFTSAMLHVVAVEDGIVAQQSDKGTTHKEWTHDNVIRAYMTPAEGTPLAFGTDCTASIKVSGVVEKLKEESPEVDAANLRVVAFLTREAELQPTGEVLNATEIPVTVTYESSVGKIGIGNHAEGFSLEGRELTVEEGLRGEVFSMGGALVVVLDSSHRCATLQPGFYIVKVNGQSPKKISVR